MVLINLQFAVAHDFRCPAFRNKKKEFLENHLPPTSSHIETLKILIFRREDMLRPTIHMHLCESYRN